MVGVIFNSNFALLSLERFTVGVVLVFIATLLSQAIVADMTFGYMGEKAIQVATAMVSILDSIYLGARCIRRGRTCG